MDTAGNVYVADTGNKRVLKLPPHQGSWFNHRQRDWDRVAYCLCGEAGRAKPPKLSAERQEQLRRLATTGEPVRGLAEAFGI